MKLNCCFITVIPTCLSITFRSFLFDLVHQLSSTTSLSLPEMSPAPEFFKVLLVQSPNFSSVGSLLLSLEYRTLCFVMFAIFYEDDHINYVITGLRLRLHFKNRKKSRNLMHSNSNFLSKSRN